MEEKVSIIIPVYNAGKYLRECLDSVLGQTYNNVEIVAVNDGSTDDSKQILEEYASKHLNVKVFHTENRGVCAARNMGLDNISGEWVMFVDADDYLVKNAIEILYNDAVNHNADMAIGKVRGENEKKQQDDSTALTIWTKREALINGLDDNPLLYGCVSKLFKYQLIKDIRFVLNKKAHEDGYFVFLALIKEPIVTVNEKSLYIYRYNAESASHAKFSDKFFDVLYFNELKRKTIEELYPELIEKSYNKHVKAHLTMLHLFCRTKDKKYNKDIKNSIAEVRKYGQYFIPLSKKERTFFSIVKYGFYWLYRILYWIKYGKGI